MTETEYMGYVYRLHFLESLLEQPTLPSHYTRESIEKEIKEIRHKLGRDE